MSEDLHIRIAKLRRMRSVSEGYIDAVAADERNRLIRDRDEYVKTLLRQDLQPKAFVSKGISAS